MSSPAPSPNTVNATYTDRGFSASERPRDLFGTPLFTMTKDRLDQA